MRDGPEPVRWVLLITEGLSMAFPAEVYSDERVAKREAERWASLLSNGGCVAVGRPFAGRWEVGRFWIRLVQAFLREETPEIWVGTYWTRHGYPEPEAKLFSGRAEARAWAILPPTGGLNAEVYETPWSVGVTFRIRDLETDCIVQLAKVVS